MVYKLPPRFNYWNWDNFSSNIILRYSSFSILGFCFLYFAGTNGWIRNWFIFTLQTLKLIYSLSSNSFRCFEGVWNLAESVFCEIIWYFLDYFEIYFWYFVFHILQKFCINDVRNTILAPLFLHFIFGQLSLFSFFLLHFTFYRMPFTTLDLHFANPEQ